MSKNTIKKESSVEKVPSSTTKKKETSDKDDNESSAKDLPPGKDVITKPTEHDVLLGRGGGTNNHSGNVKFRQLVNEHKLRYLAASKVDKPKVARDVVKIWRGFTPPGRFLTRTGDVIKKGAGSVKAEGNCWLDVGDRKAREKASQCLRERTPDVKPIIEQMQFRENAQAMAAQQQQQQGGAGGMYPGMYSFPGSAASVGSGGHSIGTNMSGEAIDNAFNVEHFQAHAANSFQHFSSNGTFASGHSGHSGGGNSYGGHSAGGQLHHRHMDPLSMASIATDERTITSGDTIISAAGSTWTDFTPPQLDGNGQGITPQQQMQQQQQYMNHHQMSQYRGSGGGGAGPTPHYQPHHPMPRPPSRPSQTSNTNVTFQGDADLPAGFPVAAVRPRNITPQTPSSSNSNNMSQIDSQSYRPSRHHHQSSYQSVGGNSGGSLPSGNNMYNTTTTSNGSQNFQPEFTNHHTAGNNMDNMYSTTTNNNNGGSDFSVAMQQSYGTNGTNGQKSWVSGFNSVDDSQQSLFFSVDGSQGPMSVNRAMMMNSGGASTNMSSMTSSSSTANNNNNSSSSNNNSMPPPSSDPTSTSTTSFAPFDSNNTSMLSSTAGGMPSTFNTIHEGEQQDTQLYQQHQQHQQQQQQQQHDHHQVQFPPSPSPSPPPPEQQGESPPQQYSPEQDTKPQKKKHNIGLNSHFNKSDSTKSNNKKSTVGSLATKSRQSQRSSRSRHSNYSADDLMSGVSLLSIDSGGNKTANTRQSLSNMSIMSEFSELSGDQLDLSVSNSILEKF